MQRRLLLLSSLGLAAGLATGAAHAAGPSTLEGTIRVSGSEHMDVLLTQWEAGFRKLHPNVRFERWLKGSGAGMYGLEMRTADIALMGRPINPYERYGIYERAWVYPLEIEVATGSVGEPGKSPAYAIFVNQANPLARLSVQQLDGIFGAERGGGWKALTWDETAARTKAQNLRDWGQLGLGGGWAGQPIRVYGPPNLGAGTITAFQTMVMGGGAIFNEDLREYADRRRMMADLAQDRFGIAYGPLGHAHPGVKALAVSAGPQGPYVPLDAKTVAERSYPLARPVYIVTTIDNDKTEIASPRLKPLVHEFLRYVLGAQGQKAVGGGYAPLPLRVVRDQLAKLDSNEMPPERKLLKDED